MSATRAQDFTFNEIHDRGQGGKIARKAFDSIGLVSLLHVLDNILNTFFHLYVNSFVYELFCDILLKTVQVKYFKESVRAYAICAFRLILNEKLGTSKNGNINIWDIVPDIVMVL